MSEARRAEIDDRTVMSGSVARLVDSAPPGPAWDDIVDERRRRARRGRVVSVAVVVLVLAATVVVASYATGPARVTSGSAPVLAPRVSLLPGSPLLSRKGPAGVWTGREMIVWGGLNLGGAFMNDGAAFDPATGAWRLLAPSPLSARAGAAAVWTGTHVLLWGGSVNGQVFDDGARYDPATDEWAMLPSAPEGSGLAQALGVWVEGRMVVGGFTTSTGAPSFVVVFDDAAGSWARIALGDPVQSLAVAGSSVAVLTRSDASSGSLRLATLDSRTGVVSAARPLPVDRPFRAALVADGRDMIVVTTNGNDERSTRIDRYDAGRAEWEELARADESDALHGGSMVGFEVATFPIVLTGGRLVSLSSQGLRSFDLQTREFQRTEQLAETRCLNADSADGWTGTEFLSWGQAPCDGSVLGVRVRPFG